MKKLLILAALVCGTAHAEFKDGNKLLSEMNGNTTNQMHALGYMLGVADALMGSGACPPTNVSAGQVYDMVKLYLETYPSTRHFTADIIVHRVLKSAWPCQQQSQRGNNL